LFTIVVSVALAVYVMFFAWCKFRSGEGSGWSLVRDNQTTVLSDPPLDRVANEMNAAANVNNGGEV